MNRTEIMKELNGESLRAESYAVIKELARAAGVCAVSEKTKEELTSDLLDILKNKAVLGSKTPESESYAVIKELAKAAGVCAVSEKTKEELIAELVKINNGAQAACAAAAASGKNKE